MTVQISRRNRIQRDASATFVQYAGILPSFQTKRWDAVYAKGLVAP